MQKTFATKVFSSILFYVMLITTPLYCLDITAGAEYYFKTKAANTQANMAVLFPVNERLTMGPCFLLGESYCYYENGRSRAHIYGPSFAIGLRMMFEINNSFFLKTEWAAKAVYATFPNILWANINLGISYFITPHFYAGAGLNLIVNKDAFDLGIGLEVMWRP